MPEPLTPPPRPELTPPPDGETGYRRFFGYELAELLAARVAAVRADFPVAAFLADVRGSDLADLGLVARTDLLAALLRRHLPADYPEALGTLLAILGPENPGEAGAFTFGYWLWPVASFIARYGLDHHDLSIAAIEELTKRHTGEFAIRPYLVARPAETARTMLAWAGSPHVQVRRLASEGLRPRLPWAPRLTVFLAQPEPVFAVLDRLKDDPSAWVRKSVANNINDYLKDNRPRALDLLRAWSADPSPERRRLIRHALRNETKRGAADALAILDSLADDSHPDGGGPRP